MKPQFKDHPARRHNLGAGGNPLVAPPPDAGHDIGAAPANERISVGVALSMDMART